MSDVRYLSPEEAARRAMFSRKVIYRAIEDGELPAFKPRGRIRIAEADFDSWMRSTPVAAKTAPQPDLDAPARRTAAADSFHSMLQAIEGGRR